MLGTLLLVLGPGNFIRLTGGTELNPGFLQRLGGIILSIRDNVALIVLLIFLIILKIKKDKLINSFIREQGIFLLSILFSLIFIVLAGAYQPRVFFGISVFSILLLFNLFAGRQQKSNSVLLISSFVIVTVIMIIEWKNVYTDLKFNYATFKADEIIWRSNDQNVFPLPKKKYNRFVSNGLGGIDKDFWSNKVMSAYYKKDHMVFIPHDLHSNIQKNTAIKDLEEADLRAFNIKNRDTSLINNHTLFYQEDSGYFILPIKQSNANLEKGDLIFITLDGFEKASFTPKETFMYYILNKEIPTINKESAQYYLIVLNDKRYLVFKKPEQIPIDKLDNIQLFDSKDNVLTVISL